MISFLTDRQNFRAHLEMISCEEDLNALQYGSMSPRWLYYLDLAIIKQKDTLMPTVEMTYGNR